MNSIDWIRLLLTIQVIDESDMAHDTKLETSNKLQEILEAEAEKFADRVIRSRKKPKKKPKQAEIPLHPLQEWVASTLPNVSKMTTQLKYDDCVQLVDKYGKKLVKDVLLAMENKKGLTSKYSSVVLTINSWAKRHNPNQDNPKLTLSKTDLARRGKRNPTKQNKI